jgi:hypothetical protein
MTRDLSIRVAVGNAAGRHSMVWSVFSTKNEVYAAHLTRGGIEKFRERLNKGLAQGEME